MRKNILLLALALSLLCGLCACGGDSGGAAANAEETAEEDNAGVQSSPGEETTSADHDSNLPEQQEKTVIMTVYDGDENVLFWHKTVYDGSVIHDGTVSLTNWVSVTSYDRDGTETGHAEHIWDEQGNSRSWYNSDGWNGGGYASLFTYYEGIGTVSQTTTTAEYNSAGQMVSSTTYNSNGEISGYSEYERNDAGQPVRSIFYSASKEPTSMTINEYNDAGKKSCTKYCDGSGGLIRYEHYEYDEAGREIATEEYSSDGTLGSRYETEYDENGHWRRWVLYSGNNLSTGVPSSYTAFEYNESGKCVMKNEYRIEKNFRNKNNIDALLAITLGDSVGLNTSRAVFTYGEKEELLSIEYYEFHYRTHDEPPEEILLGKEVYVYT